MVLCAITILPCRDIWPVSYDAEWISDMFMVTVGSILIVYSIGGKRRR